MQRYRVNEPNVVYEAFDEEVILVNLDTGNYYSVRGSGPAVWMALAQGVSQEELAARIHAATGTTDDATGADLASFAQQLVAAELLVPSDRPPAASGADIAWPGGFTAPVLEIYTDMQDLLLLDPIHDVDTAGWPLAKDP